MRSSLRTAAAIAALALPALLAPAAAHGQQQGAAIARLEQSRDRNPASAATLRALGVAYYKAGRWAEARTVLTKARELAPKDGVVALYLGMAAEQQGDLATAREAYTSYLTVGRTSRTRTQLRARLAALTRQEIALAARASIANEAALASEPGAPTTIAVLPLRFTGADSSLIPLERGLAELLVTDLSRSAKLTILERERVQALVSELQLAGTPAADPSVAPRSGRLLRAGRIVQGAILQLPNRGLDVNASVVDVPTSAVASSIQETDRLDALFALEKKVALRLFDALGVTLTPAERAQVDERPTRSMAAFLAYSAGLVAEDAGRLEEAQRLYESAARQDPAFRAAMQRQARVEAARLGGQLSTAQVEASIAGTSEGAVVASAERGIAADGAALGGTLTATVNDLNPSVAVQMLGGTLTSTQPSNRDPASSATGTDSPVSATGRITIIVRQPK